MWALEALFYIRMILLYVYLYGLPIAFALAYGNIPVVSDIAMGFCKRFVPLAVLPLPAAMVLKGYDLIYAGGAHARNSVPQISCRCVPPAGRTLHHVEDVQIRDPVDGQKVVGGATKGAALVGGVAAAGATSVAPASRRPPLGGGQKPPLATPSRKKAAARGGHGADDSGAPSYRRTENDPGGATAESTSDGRGMDFDRGIH